MPNAKLAYVTIDAADPEALAPFWAELLGVEVEMRVTDEGNAYVVLASSDDGAPAVAFQQVAEPKIGKSRVHLDLAVGTSMRRPRGSNSSVAGEPNRAGPARWAATDALHGGPRRERVRHRRRHFALTPRPPPRG